ncbi:MBL fold metallo-hydrolase [Patescibacteria group bacterium]|nr:MBL fold metallo-hydrolase [Patescibacteria group bacterium]
MISVMLLTLLGIEPFIQDRGERSYFFGNHTINIIQISTIGMQILWKGQTYCSLITQRNKQDQIRIAIDPFNQDTGLRPPSLEADIALITHEEADNIKILKGDPFVVSGPGEYEIRGVFIQGIACSREKEEGSNTIYTIEAENMRLCHLGVFSAKELTPEQVEKIGNVDILFVPVGGGNTIAAKEAAKIVGQIEPRIVIPMMYAIPKLKMKLAKVDEFLKTMGKRAVEPQAKIILRERDLGGEETKVMVVTP